MEQLTIPFRSLRGPASAITETADSALFSLESAWQAIIEEFFPTRLDLRSYVVVWSTRTQLRTLASCNIRRRKIIVAQEMDHPDCWVHIQALLYHEMCHAVLGSAVPKRGGRRCWHGREFRVLESRHPGMAALKEWIRSGGWRRAIRRHRAKRVHTKRHASGLGGIVAAWTRARLGKLR